MGNSRLLGALDVRLPRDGVLGTQFEESWTGGITVGHCPMPWQWVVTDVAASFPTPR